MTALVLGGGPIGIGVYLGLTAQGVTEVVVSEPSATRRAAIAGVGAEMVLDPARTDVADGARQLTNGRGADVVIEPPARRRASPPRSAPAHHEDA